MFDTQLPLGMLSSLLFSLMGPVALVPLFASLTAGADVELQRKIALRALAVSLLAIAIAVSAGAGALAGAGTSRSSLIIGAGMILTLTALASLFGWWKAPGVDANRPPTVATGFAPIAIPGIVTPTGVAVLIIFVSFFPSTADKFAILAVVTAILLLDFLAMLASHWFMRTIGPAPLIVLGAVFGVLQVAMGIEMIVSGLTRSSLLK